MADALIVTGQATGSSVNWSEVEVLRSTCTNVPIWIGSGINPENIAQAKLVADAVIVGTHFHKDSDLTLPLDLKRIQDFMKSLMD